MWTNMMVFIPIYFLFTNGRILTSAPLRILALSSAFNFTLGTHVGNCESVKSSAGEVTMIQPIEWKRVAGSVSMNRDNV